MPSPSVIQTGTDVPRREPIALSAGPLTMVLEPDSGFLRYVRAGGAELVRGVYAVVRDHNWDTVPSVVSDLNVKHSTGGFDVTFNVDCRQNEIDFTWHGRITGEAAGRVSYTLTGKANTTFRTNRTGFCVLHPARAAGADVVVTHASAGGETRGALPVAISPHQPFKDMAAISHKVAPDAWCDVTFAGEVFEMEDQRNWTDASYKTYCRPLEWPFPYELAAGQEVSQSITIALRGEVPRPSRTTGDGTLTITLDPKRVRPLPAIGLGTSSDGGPLTDRQVARLKALNPAHLRVDVRLSEPEHAQAFDRALHDALRLDASIELAAFLTETGAGDELKMLAHLLHQLRPMANQIVSRVMILPAAGKATDPAWIEPARRMLGQFGIPIGGGTDAYFTELNRNRPPAQHLDFLCYSINPQVHAFDDASLAETLESQGETVRSARTFAGGRPIVVSPVTLKPRFNPNATGPEPAPAPGELPSQVDVRQMSLFGAGWTLGSLKHLAEAGVQSVTYYEAVGWCGVMERENGSPLPDRFPSIPGGVFPLYQVLADVGAFAGGRVIGSTSSNPLAAESLVIEKDGRRRVLLANLTGAPQRVRIPDVTATARLAQLDQTSAEQAMRDPEAFRSTEGRSINASAGAIELELPPCAVARLDLEP